MDYTIRLDVLHQNDGEMLKKYLSKYSKYLVYEEIADKTLKVHYQGIVRFDSEEDAKNEKQRFYDMFRKHPKGSKSMAKVNKKTYEVYITKDKNCYVSKGYTQDDIDALESMSYPKKKKRESWFKTLIQYCKDQNIKARSTGWEIAAAVLKCYQEYSKVEPNDFQLRCYAKSVQRVLIQESYPERFEYYVAIRAKEIIGNHWTPFQ